MTLDASAQHSPPEHGPPWSKAKRIGALAAVAALLLAAALNGITDPWEGGWRGMLAAQWSQGAVHYHLEHGLSATWGFPCVMVPQADGVERIVNWHHPSWYWLWLTAPAWLFGDDATTLRAAHLVLWLPGILALYGLVKARLGEGCAVVCALLFASTPLVAYYGPMVLQDGAVLSCGLLALRMFDRWCEQPTGWRFCGAAAAYLWTCLLDWQGFWWGPAMFVLACTHVNRVRTLLGVAAMAGFAVAALLVTAVHFGLELGGPWQYLRLLFHLQGTDAAAVDDAACVTVASHLRELLLDKGNLPAVMLALFGMWFVWSSRRSDAYRATTLVVALAVPGVLACAAAPAHALGHVFWSMHGFASIAAAGSLVAACAESGNDLKRRICGLGIGLVVVWGALWTHVLIHQHRRTPTITDSAVTAAAGHLRGCAWTFLDVEAPSRIFVAGSWLMGDIKTPAALATCIAVARARGHSGHIGFVLSPGRAKDELRSKLDELAVPVVVEDHLVYRFVP